jgi:hypothetical protein
MGKLSLDGVKAQSKRKSAPVADFTSRMRTGNHDGGFERNGPPK